MARRRKPRDNRTEKVEKVEKVEKARKARKAKTAAKAAKAGTPFQRVVADVARAMDPKATVEDGKWVTGPDGRRDMDVSVTGTVDGEERTVLIECKDYDPRKTGPVGIRYVDEIDSKRRDLGVDAAFLCSNAGFTSNAVRKAQRVGVGLIGVMKKGDDRIRFLIPEALYTRQVELRDFQMTLYRDGDPLDLNGIDFMSIVHEGLPLGNWIFRRARMMAAVNLVVAGRIDESYRLTKPITIEWPGGSESIDRIDFRFSIVGGWYEQDVTYDASAGIYDWARRRVRLAPGPSQFHINNVVVDGGDPIDRPPEHALSMDHLPGEMLVRLLLITNGDTPDGPELDGLIHPDDLDDVLQDIPPEAFTSAPAGT
jgi:hypothetical protein